MLVHSPTWWEEGLCVPSDSCANHSRICVQRVSPRGQCSHHHFARLQAPWSQAFLGLLASSTDTAYVPRTIPWEYSTVKKYLVCESMNHFEHLVQKMSMVLVGNTFKLLRYPQKEIRQQHNTSLIFK